MKPRPKSCMHCAEGDFPHALYALYLHAIDALHAVKCEISAVTWCDVTANHLWSVVPHIPFQILPSTFCMPEFHILLISLDAFSHWVQGAYAYGKGYFAERGMRKVVNG